MVGIQPRKQPVQARAQAKCAAIREAAARILVAGGALNTNAIAELAGVSVGTLYQYYPSKQAILAELIREMRSAMLADLEAAARQSEGAGLERTVRLMIAATLRHHENDPARAEALERVEAALPLDGETARLKQRIGGLVVAVLERHGVVEPARAAQDVSAIARGMAEAAAAAGERDFADVAQRIARAVLGYLKAPGQRAAPLPADLS